MKKFFGIFSRRHLNAGAGKTVVRQNGCSAGGMTVRGDMCGGNMNVSDVSDIADGSYIGGDLKVGTPDKNEDQTLQALTKMDLQIGGRVIISGIDRTDEYRKLKKA